MRPASTIEKHIELEPIGYVESSLLDPAEAPNQGDEGAPKAWLVFQPNSKMPYATCEWAIGSSY